MHLKTVTRTIWLSLIFILTACGSASVADTPSPEASESESAPVAEQEVARPNGADTEEADTEGFVVHGEENLLAGAEPVDIERDADVPPLPFSDNPDPALCGIPQPWHSDEPAFLSGIYEGELIQSTVFLYDSHLRRKIVAEAPHGAEVRIILSQSNPELNYYLVKIVGADGPNEGWIPEPFVSFTPPPNDI